MDYYEEKHQNFMHRSGYGMSPVFPVMGGRNKSRI